MTPAQTAVHRQPSSFSTADAITLVRIPLAIAFPLVTSVPVRLAILGVAAATDLGDGWVARRFGGSHIGAVLDPIADKLFVTVAFAVVWASGQLTWFEVVGVLARDIIATVAFVITIITGKATAVPARLGGKAVTLLQMVTLVLFVLQLNLVRRFAWATAAVALYAIYDYHQPFFRKLKTR
ncbi:MAG TPA: CDP-alcohol phosphatidyltransferase family protein [Gemmatimonadales bacterium]|jgi:phosphatidylglycerophosphate synthase